MSVTAVAAELKVPQYFTSDTEEITGDMNDEQGDVTSNENGNEVTIISLEFKNECSDIVTSSYNPDDVI